MNEQEIEKAASMYALVAEMEWVKVTVDGMKAENQARRFRGESVAWGHDDFWDYAESLSEIAQRLRREI